MPFVRRMRIMCVEKKCQFHQHFSHTFFVQKCFFCQNVTREKLRKALSYEKHTHKMLMKLTPMYEFYVRTSFWQLFSSYMYVTCTWKKLPKRLSYEKCTHIKLMKLTAGVNFININAQILHVQIPKALKDTDHVTVFLHFWDLAHKSCL
jgi:hypothetical protein